MPSLSLESAEINYRTWGDGPPIVFAHGAGGNHMSWWQQIDAFSDRYTCIAFDHPGFGLSKWSDSASPDAVYGDVMVEMLDALEIERCAFVAQSMGGWSALGLALRQPERIASLTLSATFCGVTGPDFDSIIAARDPELGALRDAWRRRDPGANNPALGETAAREAPALHTLYDLISSLNPPQGPAERGTQALPRRRRWGAFTQEDLAGLKAPALLVSGEEDIIAPPAAMDAARRLIAGSSLARVRGTGHSAYFHRADEFNRLLRAHLEETFPA
jgi:3-oxoadipate enol-lactonase